MTTCPDRGRLEQLLDNLLVDTELDELEEHVEGCAACQQTLDELTDATYRELDPAIGALIVRNADEPGLDVDPIGRTLDATASDGERVGRGLPTVAGYEIEIELGRGGMGVVYKARHIRLNRTCALKMILAGAHASPQEANRFVTEAEAIARLEHPSIVRIHQIGDAAGLPFLELEYISGGGLDQQLDGTPWPAMRSARLAEQVSLGIAEAHRLGIVHRDLKPSNVLLAADGTPKVSDFGLAKLLDSKSGLTRSESVMGSPSYMAPEQAEGHAKGAGPAVDVYAVGAILYELLTGRPPFRGTTALETLEQVKANEPVPPSRLVPAVPRDIETICLKCLQKEAAKRYQTAQALADDLRRFLERRPIDARPIGGAQRAWRWCLRNRWIAGMTGVAAAAVSVGLAALVAFVLFQQRANRTLQSSNLNLLAANTREQNARRLAQTRYALARRAVEVYYTGASEDVLLKQPELEDLRKRLLQTALEFYREMAATLADSPDDTRETREELPLHTPPSPGSWSKSAPWRTPSPPSRKFARSSKACSKTSPATKRFASASPTAFTTLPTSQS